MRQLLIVLFSGAACGFLSQATAQSSSLASSLDLYAPCSGGNCTGTNPTDQAFQFQANAFRYESLGYGNYLATLSGLSAPLVCDEVSPSSSGPVSATRFAPEFSNSGGGLLEYNAGGATTVDLATLSYDGNAPAGVAMAYSQYQSPQVLCYSVNPITGGALAYASGPAFAIFRSGFEDHAPGEPWVSVQTVNSPNATASSSPLGPKGPTTTNTLAYVVQIHNASSAANWRLSLGYDRTFFHDGTVAAPWACVLPASIPQPGPTNGTCTAINLPYTLKASDAQPQTDSIYVYVDYTGTSAATLAWPTLSGGFYPAVAAVFPPYSVYPKRFDDKVAVASGNNPVTQNVGDIVCNNNTSSTSCSIYNSGGGSVAANVTYSNSISGGGQVNVDPLFYYVSPFGGSTLPSTVDTLSAANVSNFNCSDPNGIFAIPPTTGSFGTSSSANGALQMSFQFNIAGSLYVPGTATCQLTLASPSRAPALSVTQTFKITMLPSTTSHFAVSAPASATAGSAFNNLTVTALDSANNVVTTYNGTVHFASTDGNAVLPANATLSNGVGTFSATLKTAGNKTISASDTLNGAIAGTSNTIVVSAGPAAYFTVNAPPSATLGNSFNFSVAAYDQYNNPASGYSGTVHFAAPTDANAVLPADSSLTFGVGTFSATLNTAGTQTLTATDTLMPSVTGSSGSITVN